MPPQSQPFTNSHPAIDYAVDCGTELGAPFSGTVVSAIRSPISYGTHVWLQSADRPKVRALVAHMSALRVRTGQVVVAGTPIGRSGNTGHVVGNREYFQGAPPGEGCHVHFEVRVSGKAVNPAGFEGSLFTPKRASLADDLLRSGLLAIPIGPLIGAGKAVREVIDLPRTIARFFTFTLPQYLKISGGALVMLVGLAAIGREAATTQVAKTIAGALPRAR